MLPKLFFELLYYGFDPLDLGAPLFSHFVLLFSIYLPILKAYHLSFVFVCLQWNPYVLVAIYNSRRTPFCPRDPRLSTFALLISIIICHVFHSFSFRLFPVRSRTSSGLLPFFIGLLYSVSSDLLSRTGRSSISLILTDLSCRLRRVLTTNTQSSIRQQIQLIYAVVLDPACHGT